MFFEMRFDLGTLDSGEQSLPFELLVSRIKVQTVVFKIEIFTMFPILLCNINVCFQTEKQLNHIKWLGFFGCRRYFISPGGNGLAVKAHRRCPKNRMPCLYGLKFPFSVKFKRFVVFQICCRSCVN